MHSTQLKLTHMSLCMGAFLREDASSSTAWCRCERLFLTLVCRNTEENKNIMNGHPKQSRAGGGELSGSRPGAAPRHAEAEVEASRA